MGVKKLLGIVYVPPVFAIPKPVKFAPVTVLPPIVIVSLDCILKVAFANDNVIETFCVLTVVAIKFAYAFLLVPPDAHAVVVFNEIGPHYDLSMRRDKIASSDLYKEACR